MRNLLALIFLLPAISHAGSITASITDPPATYTDGTAIQRPVTFVLRGSLEGEPPRELARGSTLTLRAAGLTPGPYCVQIFVTDRVTGSPEIYSDGRPVTPWCGTVPSTTEPPVAEPPAKKPNPVGGVTFTTAAE